MKIGIDARMYGPRQGGLGRYIEQLILNLEKLNPEAEFVVFLAKKNWDEFIPSNPKFSKVLADIPWYGWREQLFYPRVIKRARLDLMHFPHWNVPLLYRGRIIVTIHDLILWHFPDRRDGTTQSLLSYFFKYQAFKIILKSVVKRASKILTTSEFSKADLINTLKINANKIVVAYQAPFTPPPKPTSSDKVLKKLNITKPFVLYVGVSYPHKNLKRLVEAWKYIEEETKESAQLILVGPPSIFYDQLTRSYEFKRCTQILYTGFVSDTDLTALYAAARLYVMPSLSEGFALPALEALAQGLPVATSKAACLPEILGNAAIYFDPEDVASIARVVVKGITNENLRISLIREQKSVLARYSGEKLASCTFEACQNSV